MEYDFEWEEDILSLRETMWQRIEEGWKPLGAPVWQPRYDNGYGVHGGKWHQFMTRGE